MFTLGVMTDEVSQDFAHALDVIEELGVHTIELGFMWDKNICDLDSHELTQVLRMVRRRGFVVCNIASLFLLHCPIDDPDAYNKHIKILERSIQIAPLFDCQLVRCFSFPREDDLEAHWDAILERLELPVRMAESAGVTLAFENVRMCNIGTGAETARLMETINSPNLRVIWDPANAYHSGEARPYPDGYELVKPWIIHVHVKDVELNTAGKLAWLPIGGGKVDYAGQFKALADDGYGGVVTLETHYRPENGTKEQGSRESFAGMQAILAEQGISPS